MFESNAIFENTLKVLELLSYVATIGGVITIIIAFIQLKQDSKKELKENDQLLIQNSINVLRTFAEQIIPMIDTAHEHYAENGKKVMDETLAELNSKLPPDQQLKKLPKNPELVDKVIRKTKNKCNYGQILNKIEQVSVYMNYNLVKEDLVYTPIHKVFLDFTRENLNYLSWLRTEEVPFENIISLYHKWNNKNDIEHLEKQKQKINEQLKKEQQEIEKKLNEKREESKNS